MQVEERDGLVNCHQHLPPPVIGSCWYGSNGALPLRPNRHSLFRRNDDRDRVHRRIDKCPDILGNRIRHAFLLHSDNAQRTPGSAGSACPACPNSARLTFSWPAPVFEVMHNTQIANRHAEAFPSAVQPFQVSSSVLPMIDAADDGNVPPVRYVINNIASFHFTLPLFGIPKWHTVQRSARPGRCVGKSHCMVASHAVTLGLLHLETSTANDWRN